MLDGFQYFFYSQTCLGSNRTGLLAMKTCSRLTCWSTGRVKCLCPKMLLTAPLRFHIHTHTPPRATIVLFSLCFFVQRYSRILTMPSSSSCLLPISAAGRVFWNKWELCWLFYVTYFPALPELYLKCRFPPLPFRISKCHPPSRQGWHWSVAHPHAATLSPPTPESAPGRGFTFPQKQL